MLQSFLNDSLLPSFDIRHTTIRNSINSNIQLHTIFFLVSFSFLYVCKPISNSLIYTSKYPLKIDMICTTFIRQTRTDSLSICFTTTCKRNTNKKETNKFLDCLLLVRAIQFSAEFVDLNNSVIVRLRCKMTMNQ